MTIYEKITEDKDVLAQIFAKMYLDLIADKITDPAQYDKLLNEKTEEYTNWLNAEYIVEE